jgi:hypothetical protein
VRKSQDRLLKDQSSILSDAFLKVCRNGKTNTLVRRRKMPLDDLVYSMINRKGLTLKLELRNYMKITHPGIEISKPRGVSEACSLSAPK